MENGKNIPKHIAIIMDGNGRWAEQHGLERVEGHRAGAMAVKTLLENLKDVGVEYVTLYAFSTENWKRSKEEVDALMELLSEFIDANLEVLKKNRVRLLVTGRMEGLPEKARNKLKNAIRETSADYVATMMALNCGGRAEIADAAARIAADAAAGKIKAEQVDEKLFAQYLYHPEVPDPDLLIRTSGELRLSNFLLWELSYSELYATSTYWPDFDVNELDRAIASYQNRNRRFGGR